MKNSFSPHTKFQKLVKDLGIDESKTILHKKQTKFNKFVNNVALYEHYNIMVDLLELPTTKEGYKYLLSAIDLGLNSVDFEPLKNKTSEETIKAMQKIFKRKYVKEPKYTISTDGGGEFKGSFKKWFADNDIYQKISQSYRHSQQAPIEALNKLLSRILLGYLNDIELKTQERYVEWTDILDKVRIKLNDHMIRQDLEEMRENTPIPDLSEKPVFSVGDYVHYKLDRPYDALNNVQSTTNFRKGDILYSPTVHRIEQILIFNDQPYYRYVLSSKKNVSYSEYQLILADKKDETFLVKNFLDKKKINGVMCYLVWFKGELKKNAMWVTRKSLIEDGFEKEIKEFDHLTRSTS